MMRTKEEFPAAEGRRRRLGGAAGLAIAAALLLETGVVRAAPDAIKLPGDRVYPENVVATTDGTLYVSSLAHGGVIRVPPGAGEGSVWIEPGSRGTRGTFGMLPDERSGVLWVCSNDLGGMGVQTAGDAKGSSLKALDLKTGESRSSVALPGEHAICNDIARGADGSLYVTNTLAPQILKLRPGASSFETFSNDPLFDAGPNGAGRRDGAVGVSTPAEDARAIESAFEIKIAGLSADVGADEPLLPVVSAADDSVAPHDGALEPDAATRESVNARNPPITKTVRHRNKEHLRFVRTQPCLICAKQPSDPHHLPFAQPRALGRKVSDQYTVPLCRAHHREAHRAAKELGWWQSVGIAPLAVAEALWQKSQSGHALNETPEPPAKGLGRRTRRPVNGSSEAGEKPGAR